MSINTFERINYISELSNILSYRFFPFLAAGLLECVWLSSERGRSECDGQIRFVDKLDTHGREKTTV